MLMPDPWALKSLVVNLCSIGDKFTRAQLNILTSIVWPGCSRSNRAVRSPPLALPTDHCPGSFYTRTQDSPKFVQVAFFKFTSFSRPGWIFPSMQGLWSSHRRKVNLNAVPVFSLRTNGRLACPVQSSNKRRNLNSGVASGKDSSTRLSVVWDRRMCGDAARVSGDPAVLPAMAGELGVPFISISATSAVSGMSGESVKTLRHTFKEAKMASAIPQKSESAQTHDDFFLLSLKQVQLSSKCEGFAMIQTSPERRSAHCGHQRQALDGRPARGHRGGCGVTAWMPEDLACEGGGERDQGELYSVKGPELLNKYVGESERAVRQASTRARASAPRVVFFDEIDALVPRRDAPLRKAVYVLIATNSLDMIDGAMCRPGWLDNLLYVDLPSADERIEIMRTVTRKLVRETGVVALRRTSERLEVMDGEVTEVVKEVAFQVDDFMKAVDKIGPSVSAAHRRRYAALRDRYAGLPATGGGKRGRTMSGGREFCDLLMLRAI
ncbi:AAA-domain-containing protein [Heliocybe sulcata]|uniref:AAA-domain-containing protein n=1 Tax=Heliocybe sulcata TaxID=5364 RepID=A0A5C3MJ78_9AGAM|nr:AAA-domain-containing protein [Heliocybe sulcata]